MPHHAGRFDPKVGVAMSVLIVPRARYTFEELDRLIRARQPPSPPSGLYCPVLLDTGTKKTMITQQVVEELKLSSIGDPRSLAGSTGMDTGRPYEVDLLLPFDDGNKFFPKVEVLGLSPKLGGLWALLGLDILCKGDLALITASATFGH